PKGQLSFSRKVPYKRAAAPFAATGSDFRGEAYLGADRPNRILSRLNVRLGDRFTQLGTSRGTAERRTLETPMAGLGDCAAPSLVPEELTLIMQFLQETWELSEANAAMFITMALCRECTEQQIPSFCVRYLELSTYEERQALYLLLGKIARIDRGVSKRE